MSANNKKRSVNSSVTTSETKSAPAARTASRSGSTAEFNPDYSYVKKDLTRIAILAGSFFVILVVLAFFLR